VVNSKAVVWKSGELVCTIAAKRCLKLKITKKRNDEPSKHQEAIDL
jgi:hypothetical protein